LAASLTAPCWQAKRPSELLGENRPWQLQGESEFEGWLQLHLAHLKSFRTSRKEARQAVKNRLYSMFVSHLVCERTGKGLNCKTIVNDTTHRVPSCFPCSPDGMGRGT
jgi:hypothetical protein